MGRSCVDAAPSARDLLSSHHRRPAHTPEPTRRSESQAETGRHAFCLSQAARVQVSLAAPPGGGNDADTHALPLVRGRVGAGAPTLDPQRAAQVAPGVAAIGVAVVGEHPLDRDAVLGRRTRPPPAPGRRRRPRRPGRPGPRSRRGGCGRRRPRAGAASRRGVSVGCRRGGSPCPPARSAPGAWCPHAAAPPAARARSGRPRGGAARADARGAVAGQHLAHRRGRQPEDRPQARRPVAAGRPRGEDPLPRARAGQRRGWRRGTGRRSRSPAQPPCS